MAMTLKQAEKEMQGIQSRANDARMKAEDIKARIEDFKSEIEDLRSTAQDIEADIESVKGEVEEYRDDKSEKWQESDKGELYTSYIDELDTFINNLNAASFGEDLEDAIDKALDDEIGALGEIASTELQTD